MIVSPVNLTIHPSLQPLMKINTHASPYSPRPLIQGMSSISSVSTTASPFPSARSSFSSTQSQAMTPRRVIQPPVTLQLRAMTPRRTVPCAATPSPPFPGFVRDVDASLQNHHQGKTGLSGHSEVSSQSLALLPDVVPVENMKNEAQIVTRNAPIASGASPVLRHLGEEQEGNDLFVPSHVVAPAADPHQKAESASISLATEKDQLAKASDKQTNWVTTVINAHLAHAAHMEEAHSKVAAKDAKSHEYLEKRLLEARASLAERKKRRDSRLNANYNRSMQTQSARQQELSNKLSAKDSFAFERLKYLHLAREEDQVEKARVRRTRSASTVERSRRLEEDRQGALSEKAADVDARILWLKQQKESIREKRRILQGEAHKVLEQFKSNIPNQNEIHKYKRRAIRERMEDVAERGAMAGWSVPYTLW